MTEALLNIIWGTLGLSALIALAISEVWLDAGRTGSPLGRRILCVTLATLCLFPCVSSSDDRLSMANLQFTAELREDASDRAILRTDASKPQFYLSQLFTDLQNFPIPAVGALPDAGQNRQELAAPAARLEGGPSVPAFGGRGPPAARQSA